MAGTPRSNKNASAGETTKRILGDALSTAINVASPAVAASRAAARGLQAVKVPVTQFAEGFMGVPDGYYSTGAPAPVAAASAAAPTRMPVAQLSVSPGMTPSEQAAAAANQILSRPHSVREAQIAVGLMPAPNKPQSAKDRLYEDTGTLADQIFALRVAAIDKSDASLDEKKQARAAEMDALLRQRQAALGVNLQNVATAEQIAAAVEDQ